MSSPENAMTSFLRDSGGQFERTAVVVSAVLRYDSADGEVNPVKSVISAGEKRGQYERREA